MSNEDRTVSVDGGIEPGLAGGVTMDVNSLTRQLDHMVPDPKMQS